MSVRYWLTAFGYSAIGLVLALLTGLLLTAFLGTAVTLNFPLALILGTLWGWIVGRECSHAAALRGGDSDAAMVMSIIVGATLLVAWPLWGQVINANWLAPSLPDPSAGLAAALDAYDPVPFLLATAAVVTAVYALVIGGMVALIRRYG